MIGNLRMKVELREEIAQTSMSAIEESEIEQAIDSYMMKEENKKKMVTAGLLPQIGAYWDNGLRFKSRDGNFKLKVVGRIMNDWGWFDEDNGIKRAIGDQVDGTEFRSALFYMKGSIYKNIGYKLQLDYAGGNINFNDVFMELKKIPILGNFRVGHTKEPFSLETMNSRKFMTFLERGLNNAFVPQRNTGFRVYNHAFKDRISWSAGVFRNANSFGDSKGNSRTEGGYSFSGRITGLPWYEDGGAKLIHTGISYSYQNAFAEGTEADGITLNETGFQFSSKPEINAANTFVDTSRFHGKV